MFEELLFICLCICFMRAFTYFLLANRVKGSLNTHETYKDHIDIVHDSSLFSAFTTCILSTGENLSFGIWSHTS